MLHSLTSPTPPSRRRRFSGEVYRKIERDIIKYRDDAGWWQTVLLGNRKRETFKFSTHTLSANTSAEFIPHLFSPRLFISESSWISNGIIYFSILHVNSVHAGTLRPVGVEIFFFGVKRCTQCGERAFAQICIGWVGGVMLIFVAGISLWMYVL